MSNKFETERVCDLAGAEDNSSASLLYKRENAEAAQENNVKSSHNNFTNFYPPILNKEKNMGKLASFLVGVITGAVVLGVTACLVEKHSSYEEDTTNSSCENEQEKNTSSADEEQSSNSAENLVTAL